MKNVRSTNYDSFMENILGGQETLEEAREVLGEGVFDRILRTEQVFSSLVDKLEPSAIAAGVRRSARNQGVKGITWDVALSKVDTVRWKDPDFAEAMKILVAQSLQQTIAFQLAGQQTYRFAVDLSDRLLRTNIDVPAKMFKLPHKCFQTVHQSRESVDVFCEALELLRPELRVKPESAYGGQVSSMISLVEEGPSGGRELFIEYQLFLPPGGSVTSRTLMVTLPMGAEEDDRLPDLISSRTMSLPNDYPDPDMDDMPLFDERVSALLRLAANSALYLISAHADVGDEKNPYADLKRKSVAKGLPAKQRKKAVQELRHTCKSKVRDVGRKFETVKFGDSRSSISAPSGIRRPTTKRFIVSGHWKVQRFGPKYAESKLIFVEPYAKGPDAAEIVSGNYYVPNKARKIVSDE